MGRLTNRTSPDMSNYPARQNPGRTRTPPYRVSCCPDCPDLGSRHFHYGEDTPFRDDNSSLTEPDDTMSGRRFRDKGARTERTVAKVLQANAFAAAKISRAYQPSHDVVSSLSGRDLFVEVKARADLFRDLYNWLDGRDILIVKADHKEPLVVLRMSLAMQIAERAA